MIYSISSSSKNLYFHQLAADAGQTLVERKHFDLETLKQHINDAKVQFEDIDLRDAVNVNAYMDRVTELLREEILIEGLDNIALPDGNLGFNMSFWPFGRVFGGVKLYNGFLKGVETISRVGDAMLS